MRLPGGFSPKRFVQQAGSYVNPTGGVADYDVFSDVSFEGGQRNPTQQTGSVLGVSYGPQSTATGPGGGGNAPAGSEQAGVNAGGGDLGGGAFYDPYAAARSAFTSRLGGAIGNIRTNAMDAFGGAGRSLRGSAESLFNTVKQGQGAIDRSRENIEMNRLAGVDDILSFVRNGLKSGGARLANMNATESSASRELGRAFGSEGGNRMRKVGNQSFLQNREVDTQQEQLNLQKGQGRTDFARARDDMVSTIGQQVRNQLAELQQQAMELGVSGPEVEAEKQRIIDEGIGQLNEVDGWLQEVLGGVAPTDQANIRKNAVALRQGGQGDIKPFDFGEFSVANRGVGPTLDQLPIFTRTRRDQ